MDKKHLLRDMFLKYWQWNVDPVLDNPPVNSPEYFVLSMFDNLKENALAAYPWRCAIKYKTYNLENTTSCEDRRYKHESFVPDDFIIAVGFWEDAERRQPRQNSVDIVGRMLRTNLKTLTMAYVSKDVEVEEMDPWVCDFIEIFIASELSDLGGQTPDRKQYFNQLLQEMLIKCGNKDYEMAQKDPISSSIFQFTEWC